MKTMNQRQNKVAEEIRHVVGMALLRGEIYSRVDLSRVTVTAVWASADLRQARIYVAMPSTWKVAPALADLNAYVAVPLRKVLAKQLATKYIPALTFFESESGV